MSAARSTEECLQRAEALFHFADEFHELRLGDDLGIPAEVALDQVVGFDDMRTGQGRRKSRRGKYLPKTRGVYCN